MDENLRSVRTARSSELFAVAIAVLAVAYFLLPTKTAKLTVWPVISWSAVAAILVGVRINRPEPRSAWYFLAGGMAALVLGDALFGFQYLQNVDVSSGSYTDAVYMLMYPLLVVGMALLIKRRTVERDRTVVLDAAIITSGLGLVWWVLLLASYFRDRDLSWFDRLSSTAFPLGDIVVLATAIRLVVAGGRRPLAFWLLGGGLLSLLISDALYGYLTLSDSWGEHSPVDAGWIIFYAAWGAAALHPSMRAVSEPGDSSRPMGPGRLAIVGSAVVIPPAMLFAQDALGSVNDATPIALTGALVLALVVARIIGIVRSVADARSETRIRALVDKSSDSILVIDSDARITYHSRAAEQLFFRSDAELTGANLAELLRESDARHLSVMLSSPSPTMNVEWRLRQTDGHWRDLEVVADDLRGTAEVDGVVLTLRDVTRRKQMDLELRHQALHDSLTGLPNRVLFVDRVEQAMRRAERRNGSVTVLFVDLDDFKLINDSLGHGAGDTLLVAVAARLLTSMRAGDTIARLGGDEFGVLLEADVDEGAATATRVEDVLRQPFVIADKPMRMTASTGIAMGSLREKSADDLLRDAELAMYIAKRRGKGRYELFRPEMHHDAARRLDTAAELLVGMEGGEVTVFYQPIVELRTGRIAGAEALARWQHPRRGLLGPDQFIPVAESTGLIAPLDRLVLSEACRQTADWKREGLCDDSFYVSVNVSGRHLQEVTVDNDVRDAVESTELGPSSLVLEVTETALIDDVDSATAILSRLKEIGVRIAVDDFGTGYSSLTHLVKFPLDFIKIDKSFVDRVCNGSGGEVMVRAVIDLAHTLGLNAVAEGVEGSDQAQALMALKCSLAQGYLFSRPVAADAMTKLLSEGGVPQPEQRRPAVTST